MSHFDLFVYGTLKHGYANHNYFCHSAIDSRPAQVIGRLYDLNAGYPAMDIPESSILLHGTLDIEEDISQQQNLKLPEVEHISTLTGWDRVQGEVMRFNHPQHEIPPIDRLEGFNPGRSSLYDRVLVLAEVDDKPAPVWCYRASERLISHGIHIKDGLWVGHRCSIF